MKMKMKMKIKGGGVKSKEEEEMTDVRVCFFLFYFNARACFYFCFFSQSYICSRCILVVVLFCFNTKLIAELF